MNTKVFSFGISDSCDTELVKSLAQEGNGCHQLIGDNDMSFIKEAVMQSLKRSSAKSMRGCTFNFGNGQVEGFNNGEITLNARRDLGSLYENEVVRVFSIMTEEEFAKMNCMFSCEYDPRTMEPFEQSIDKGLFKETESQDKNFLFKLAANNFIRQQISIAKKDIQEVAVRYQVLSKHTELVGVSRVNQPQSAPQQVQPKSFGFGGPVQKEAFGKRTKATTISNQIMSQ